MYPEPYPPLRASRLVGLIAMATCNRWQTRVDREGRRVNYRIAQQLYSFLLSSKFLQPF